jgi:hypothetical protein
MHRLATIQTRVRAICNKTDKAWDASRDRLLRSDAISDHDFARLASSSEAIAKSRELLDKHRSLTA